MFSYRKINREREREKGGHIFYFISLFKIIVRIITLCEYFLSKITMNKHVTIYYSSIDVQKFNTVDVLNTCTAKIPNYGTSNKINYYK